MRSRYYAVSTARLCELLREAGFAQVKRVDGAFYQPLLIGTRSDRAPAPPRAAPRSFDPAR